jgi:hypothetical protein
LTLPKTLLVQTVDNSSCYWFANATRLQDSLSKFARANISIMAVSKPRFYKLMIIRFAKILLMQFLNKHSYQSLFHKFLIRGHINALLVQPVGNSSRQSFAHTSL